MDQVGFDLFNSCWFLHMLDLETRRGHVYWCAHAETKLIEVQFVIIKQIEVQRVNKEDPFIVVTS